MKNVTKILTAAVLCAAVFASTERTDALGANPAFWPGDEANIAAFPAQINNHGFVQVTDANTGTAGVDMVFSAGGNNWGLGFSDDDDTWFDLGWGNGGMGMNISMLNSDDGAGNEVSGYALSYGNVFDWGELGFHYNSGDGVTEGIELDFRKSCGFWVFTDMVANLDAPDDDDMTLDVDWFGHMDAGAADVMFAMGFVYDEGAGSVTQTANAGVEAAVTSYATLRGGMNWAYQISGDDDVVGNTAYGWTMGAGLSWDSVTADFALASGFWGNPLGYISGSDDDAAWGNVTLTYSF